MDCDYRKATTKKPHYDPPALPVPRKISTGLLPSSARIKCKRLIVQVTTYIVID